MQDSITKVKDIVFLQQNRTLVMIANRFMWEDLEKGLLRKNKRIKCAIKFEEVIKVISKNINKKYENRPIECLAIESNLTENNNYNINIFFSGGGVIIIIAEAIDVVLNDLGRSWTVKHMPKHII